MTRTTALFLGTLLVALTTLGSTPSAQGPWTTLLDGSLKGKGATYPQYSGFCIETQAFPNAINLPAWEKQVILGPEDEYKHTMVHRFAIE